MQLVPYRTLRNQPGELRRLLATEGGLVITANNEPFAVMLDITPDQLEEAVELIRRLRAQRAVSAMRREAQSSGTAGLTEAEIEAEVQAARAERRSADRT